MDHQQQPQSGVPGPAGRRLHIAHRRSPSEMTPMIMEQLALQQQIEMLQQQQQQIAATHAQYVNMGMIPQPQQVPQVNFPAGQNAQVSMAGISPHNAAFQFPQQLQQAQLSVPMNNPGQASAHRRNQSAVPNMSMGPPPAPSSGASGSTFGDPNQAQNRDSASQRGGRGGGSAGQGHQRRHSLALPEAKKAAELAQQKRNTSGFQFPIPGAGGASPSSTNRSLSPAEAEDKGTDGQGQLPNPSGLSVRAGNRGMGHGRSQSMAVGNGRGGGQQGRGAGGFQFPPPMATNDAGVSPVANQSDVQRRGSQGGHGRTSSRNFDGNWRQQGNGNQPQLQEQQPPSGNFSQLQNPQANVFQPGHRAGRSMNQSIGSMGAFQFPSQPQLVQLPQGQVIVQQPQMFPGQQVNQLQLNQLQALQAAQMNGQQFVMPTGHPAQTQLSAQQQQQQQRKTLFTPYLPQASLPALLGDGQLVAGILRVNKKNRSDAYVTASDLDADIFICGSKDRNRALEGDYVAVELLDVDEVWGQKREKEEKKKRKDITDSRPGASSDRSAKNDATTTSETGSSGGFEGGIKRRGSLRQRPTQKKNDDVEVEGQSLLLMEEEEINDEQKPLFAGHVVAVVERIPGQMFSGTLGLLRPSSQATKEKQEAEREQRGGGGRQQQDRHQDKPKIVWFKPTDKRVPLIAIPTEQAPRDFVENHQNYANRIFVACIKRWPITSLHPFGTLVELLGEMGNPKVETDALLRDNNFGPDDFSEAVLKNIGFDEWSVSNESEEALASRKDFRAESAFTIDPTGTQDLDDAMHVKQLDDGSVEVGIHVADAAHFVKPNSLVDREAKKRGTGVYLTDRAVAMLPPRLACDICSLSPGQDRFTISVTFKVNLDTGKVVDDSVWIGKGIIKSVGKTTYEDVDAVVRGQSNVKLEGVTSEDIQTLKHIAQKFREARFGGRCANVPALRLLYQLDDENVPVEHNIFDSTPAHEIIEELSHKANSFVAQNIAATLGEKAFLRRHAPPNPRRLQTFAERMTRIGYEIDTSSSGALQNSLFKVKDEGIRMGMETLLVKTMQRAKYVVAGKVRQDQLPHFALNLPMYTHFTNPSRRYADIVVHRQLEAALSNESVEFAEDMENLNKTADSCNTKKDSAQSAQEQSVHIESCRVMDKKRNDLGSDLISEGIVICVYESAFDVLIPDYGFEKRVHCDQLPLKKAEFRKEERVLELYWERDQPSSGYVPEDERKPRWGSKFGGRGAGRDTQGARESSDTQPKQTETETMPTGDVEALFDEDDNVSEITEATAGVSLEGHEQAMQQSSVNGNRQQGIKGAAEAKLKDDKERYLKMMKLREEGGECIQDVVEMTRIPVILKTDLTKSPPCLTIRSINPYAL